jgi:hypothetical protein
VYRAQRLVSSWPALWFFGFLVVRRVLRAVSHFVFSCCAVRAVRRSVAFVVSSSFVARRPKGSWHCRALKAAVSCMQMAVASAAV